MKQDDLPVASLRFGFQQIPEDGLEFRFEESFQSLWKSESLDRELREELEEALKSKVSGLVRVRKVGAKADCRGSFETHLSVRCDRCLESFDCPIQGDLTHFLMPREQFSKHDKPGGKVVHGHRKGREASRHRSRTKDFFDLTDAPDDHEDVAFGSFDGVTVDLEAYLREALILALPVRRLCREDCLGLCDRCGQNLNLGPCGPDCQTRSPGIEAVRLKI